MHASVRGLVTPSPRSPLALQARASGQTGSQPQMNVEAEGGTIGSSPAKRRVEPPPLLLTRKEGETIDSHREDIIRSRSTTPRNSAKRGDTPPRKTTASSPAVGRTSGSRKDDTPRKSDRATTGPRRCPGEYPVSIGTTHRGNQIELTMNRRHLVRDSKDRLQVLAPGRHTTDAHCIRRERRTLSVLRTSIADCRLARPHPRAVYRWRR